MDFYTGVILFLCLTVCQGSQQTLSTLANTDTSTPVLDDNSLTTQAGRSFNLQAMTVTSARLAVQTSGLHDVTSISSSLTASDYVSPFVTSHNRNSELTNIPGNVYSGVMITSSVSVENVVPTRTVTSASKSSSVISVNERTHVLTSAAHLQVTPSVLYESQFIQSSVRHVQPSSTVASLMSSLSSASLEVPVHQVTSSQSRRDTISSLSQFSTPSLPASEDALPPNQVSQSQSPSVALSTSINTSNPSQLGSVIAPSVLLSSSVQKTSEISAQNQESVRSSYSYTASSVMLADVSTGWGQFMDQVTETLVDASSHSVVSSHILPPSSPVTPASSSLSVQPTVASSTGPELQLPVSVASLGLVTSSLSHNLSSVREVMSTALLETSVPLVEVQTSPLAPKTSSVTAPHVDEISTSSPPQFSEQSISISSTSEPLPALSSVAHLSSQRPTVDHITSTTGIFHESSSSGEITHESRETTVLPSSTSVPTVTQQTSGVVMPSRTEHFASSTLFPASTSTTQTPTTTKPTSTHQDLRDCYFELTFDVECAVILNNSLILAEFVGSLKNVLVVNLKISPDRIKLYDPLCGSLIIHIGLTQVPYNTIKHRLYGQFQQEKFEVPIMVDNALLKLKGVKVIEIDPPRTLSPIEVPETGLDKVDLIVIIVACCICGILITIGVILCAKECYRRKYAQSFDLLEVPHVNLKLEDFTLTRIPRPKAVYGDESVTMQAFMDNSSNRIVKNNGQNGTNGNGVHSNDVHVRMKQNKDGLVVGVTGYTSQKSSGLEKKRNSSDAYYPGDPATENLLQQEDSSRQMGASNPIFVDDESLATFCLEKAGPGASTAVNLQPSATVFNLQPSSTAFNLLPQPLTFNLLPQPSTFFHSVNLQPSATALNLLPQPSTFNLLPQPSTFFHSPIGDAQSMPGRFY